VGLACAAALRPAAQTATTSPVHLSLRSAAGRTSFISGEPIRLEMVLTTDQPGYVVDIEGPDDATDDLTLSPTDGTMRLGAITYRDVVRTKDLSATPVVIPITLNYWVRFDRTGDYTINVATKRVTFRDMNAGFRSRPPVPAVSDKLTLHIEVLDELSEQRLVGSALSHLDAASTDATEQMRAAEELAFLPGDAAALAKYRVYSELGQQRMMISNARYAIERGFAMSRRPALILEQFERELTDLSRPISSQAVDEAAKLRMLVEHPETAAQPLSPFPSSNSADPRAGIKRRYVDEAIASLPARTGRNRIDSAVELLRVTGFPPPPVVLDIVLDGFDQLPITTRYDLTISVLHDVRDPRLTAALSHAVSEATPEYKNALIDALAARDPAAAIAPLIAELRNPGSMLLSTTIENMPKGSLTAAGSGILSALETLALSPQKNQFRMSQKAAALEMLADGSVLTDVRTFYEANKRVLGNETRARLLAYLARWDEKNGASLLREAVNADGRLIDQLSRSKNVPGLAQLSRERLFDEDTDIAVISAAALRSVGVASDRSLIEQRLARWRDAFRARAAAETREDGFAEVALFMAATDGHEWRLAGADWDRLHSACVTEHCRALTRPRRP